MKIHVSLFPIHSDPLKLIGSTIITFGDYIFRYPNFCHGKPNSHGNAIELTFRRNSLERR